MSGLCFRMTLAGRGTFSPRQLPQCTGCPIDKFWPCARYVWSRRPDTYFLRSNECVLAARLQNMHPSPCRECDDGEFGSKFVTVVVTGNQQNELDYVAYQV